MDLKERARKLKIDIPAVFLALSEKETPISAKLLAGITIAYALSPIDLIPDFIPVLGYLDDIIILPCLIALTVRLIPPAVLVKCRTHAEGLWVDKIPKKWYFALPIVLIWMLVIYLIIKAIWF
ncbi:YkvA family protein [Anaerocolumna jejuensis]|uniref:YkvA family protein n=1 Tax=Anaerocolumna jejuensis TaxID=259063 RepID=UPI003F7C00A2